MLKISVYDTQCGCKVMNYNLIPDLFEEKFISKWLFDVELFFRLKRKFGENNIRENCLEVALKNATFIYTKQLQENGNLNHSYKNGSSTINGFLEDYATVIEAYISLYEATANELWLQTAKQLTDYSLDHFFDLLLYVFPNFFYLVG